MNLILVNSLSHKQKLAASDRRSEHVRSILGNRVSEGLFVGFRDGHMGKARVTILENGDVELEIEWFEGSVSENSRFEMTLLIPYCRPQTCRKILRDAPCLGITRLLFFVSGKAEAGYAASSLWHSGEWEQQLIQGVEQSFHAEVPDVVRIEGNLEAALSKLGDSGGEILRIGLDNYEAESALGSNLMPSERCVLAIGPERGWSTDERDQLRANGFVLKHMGPRVLRTETAVVAACSVISSFSSRWECDTAGYLSKITAGHS